MAKRALLILAEGFEEIEAVTALDVLWRAGVQVTLAGLAAATVKGAHDLAVTADTTLDRVRSATYDAVILPGGMPGSKNLGASSTVRDIAVRHAAAGKIVAAICAAPAFTLGKFGLLDGRKATCYPGCEQEFPASVVFTPDKVVTDGNVVTSRGPGTALAFAFELVRLLVDAATAEKLAAAMQAK
jgi:4-methyl-5(b-hydroxyethyl)-thiazole monophosphate biosynthesis